MYGGRRGGVRVVCVGGGVDVTSYQTKVHTYTHNYLN